MKAALARRYPTQWLWPDERFDGLLGLANAINDAFDLATGESNVVAESELAPDVYPIWTPLRLAGRMREAAQRVEELTEG